MQSNKGISLFKKGCLSLLKGHFSTLKGQTFLLYSIARYCRQRVDVHFCWQIRGGFIVIWDVLPRTISVSCALAPNHYPNSFLVKKHVFVHNFTFFPPFLACLGRLVLIKKGSYFHLIS